jgi:hypothetical protein
MQKLHIGVNLEHYANITIDKAGIQSMSVSVLHHAPASMMLTRTFKLVPSTGCIRDQSSPHHAIKQGSHTYACIPKSKLLMNSVQLCDMEV